VDQEASAVHISCLQREKSACAASPTRDAAAHRRQRHRWFQDERWYDLLVILDDANSEIHYAQLVEEEATATVAIPSMCLVQADDL
jgi:hypothetical protein